MKYIRCDHCDFKIKQGHDYVALFSLNFCSDECMHRNINDLCYHLELVEGECEYEENAE